MDQNMGNERKGNTLRRFEAQNPWVSLVRIFMCLVVIRDHYDPVGDTIPQIFMAECSTLAVPCFMFFSFFFIAKDVRALDIEKLKERLLRLYIPILFWSLAYWTIKNVLFLISGKTYALISVEGLLENLLFSHVAGLTTQMWFMFVQIVILILIFVLLSYVRSDRGRVVLLSGMLVGALLLEYLGTNFALFDGSSDVIQYPLGRTIECIPYAIMGLLFAWYMNERGRLLKYILVITFAVGAVLSKQFVPVPLGFGYGGSYLLFISLAICILAFALPDVIKGKIRYAINYVGACTMGIYCLHLLIGWMLESIVKSGSALARWLFAGTLIFDVIIFVISFAITVLIRAVNKKLKWKWVTYVA